MFPKLVLRVISSLGSMGSRPDLLAKLKRRCREEEGRGWVKRGGAIAGDWEGMH